ncbi:MAG: HAD family phosphatase [Pedobacter sp.]|nr:MAG: HAD family phosphatase [Pedobacter sp.]
MGTASEKKIKNIIFDYGNVIFEIDFKKAQNSLAALGIPEIESFFGHKGHHELFSQLETGSITAAQFREGIRAAAGNKNLTDDEIDAAWNSILIGVPNNVHDVLLEVKQKYRTFLLSNTNEIHYNFILEYLQKEFEMENNDHLFEKAYYSQIMLLRKPHVEIFERVLEENDLKPEETLFIDDSPQHLVGAKASGMQTLLMDKHPKDLRPFLVEKGLL